MAAMKTRNISEKPITRTRKQSALTNSSAKIQKPSGPIKKLRKPDATLLRAKLILAARTAVNPTIVSQIQHERPDAPSKPWIADSTGTPSLKADAKASTALFKKRFYVLDGETWELKQYGKEWEAALVAQKNGTKNPSIDAGNNVWIFIKDSPKEHKVMKFVQKDFAKRVMHFQARQREIRDLLPPLVLSPIEVREKQRKLLLSKKKELGMKGSQRGSLLYWHVFDAVKKIRAGEA